MRYRDLGDTGVSVSAIGYGSWPLAGKMGAVDQGEATAALRIAIDGGVTLVDTAQGYYDAEVLLAPVLSQVDRDKVFLVSKVSRDYESSAIERAVEASLCRLGTDHLDLYFVHHWPDRYPLEAVLGTMARIRERGLVRFLGVSNFDAAQTRQALAITPIEAVQPRYSLLVREVERELLPLCRDEGIGVLAHSSLAKGLLSGRYDRGAVFAAADERSRMPGFQGEAYVRAMDVVDGLRDLAAARGTSVAQMALAWVLRDPVVTCALVGPKRPAQMAEAVAAADLELSDDEIGAMDRLADGNEPALGAFDARKSPE